MTPTAFSLDWQAGASAQIELFSPKSGVASGSYQLKYTPAYRSTLRPPVEERPLGRGELDPINDRLRELFGALEGSRGGGGGNAAGDAAVELMRDLGNQLFCLMLPPYIRADLSVEPLLLDLGLDEGVVAYPWELMHNGEEFLCLKHAVGRFVNISRTTPPGQTVLKRSGSWDKLSILLVSVPNPQPRADGTTFEKLPEVEAEAQAIIDLLNGESGVQVSLLAARDATYDRVSKALREGYFHILHFCGHARFNSENPRLSGLVLYDRDMTTGAIYSYVGQKPPTLCFINACETARMERREGTKQDWKKHYDIFDLARAFLDTESYLLGSRWRIHDKTASSFARAFYRSLIIEETSLGHATMEARRRARQDVPEDPFGWASYLLYGDPRMCIRRRATP